MIFDLKDSPNFSFQKALTNVKFWFQEIGEPDPFRPNQQVRDPVPVQIPLYSSCNNPIVIRCATGNDSYFLSKQVFLSDNMV